MWIFAQILTEITGKPRYFEHEEWNPHSITSCLFTAFRKVFWRRHGLQPQMTSWNDTSGNGGYTFHTWEALLVHTESKVRQWLKSPSFSFLPKLKLVKVYIPMLSPVGAPSRARLNTPYIFAIGHDTDTSGVTTSNTTGALTFNHTCVSGSVLIVGDQCDNAVAIPTAVTYNSASLTVASSITTRVVSQWYITNPTTGSSLVVSITPNGSSWQGAGATSWTGANTSSLIGATNTATATNTTVSTSVTTTVANSVIQDDYYLNDRSKTSTPNQTLAWSADLGAGEGTRNESQYQITTTTGSYTLSWSLSGTSLWVSSIIEIVPASSAAATSPTHLLTLMGVGQ